MADQEKGRDSSSGERGKESAPKLGNERPTIGPQGEAIVICHQGRFILLVSHLFFIGIFIGGYQFDFLNWFYWSLWWQQYWASLQYCGPPGGSFPSVNPWAVPAPPSSSTGTEQQNRDAQDAANRPDHVTDYQQQWMQYYSQMNASMNQQLQHHMPPFPQQPFAGGGDAYQRGAGAVGQQQARPGLTLRIRMITGGPAIE